jgi:hypothetical protein
LKFECDFYEGNMKKLWFFLGFFLIGRFSSLWAGIVIDDVDPEFKANVVAELNLMREGKRGIVCQELVERIELSSAIASIRPVTKDEKTWHPNDSKGTRSHLVPLDTRPRGSSRKIPTSVNIFIHPSRVDPKLSLFKLGTFVYHLALALDFVEGSFSGDYKVEEKRAVFFKNAWRDALHLSLFEISDRVPTEEYQEAKAAGLITPTYRSFFPILDIATVNSQNPIPSPSPTEQISLTP